MFGQFILIPFISQTMVFNVGLTDKELPQIYFFGGLANIFTGPLIGKLSDTYGKKQIFWISAILSLFPIFIIANLGQVAIWYALAATTGFFIFSSGRGIVANAIVTNTVAPQHRGSFMSINGSLQQLSAGLATLIGGHIVYQASNGQLVNLPIVGYISIGFSVVAIFVMAKIKAYVVAKPVPPRAKLVTEETAL